MEKRYRTISIPEEMFKQIEKVVKEKPELGYSSVADFVKNAIREKLKALVESRELSSL